MHHVLLSSCGGGWLREFWLPPHCRPQRLEMQSWWQGLQVLHKHLQLLEPISEPSPDWAPMGLLVWIGCGGSFLSTGDAAV